MEPKAPWRRQRRLAALLFASLPALFGTGEASRVRTLESPGTVHSSTSTLPTIISVVTSNVTLITPSPTPSPTLSPTTFDGLIFVREAAFDATGGEVHAVFSSETDRGGVVADEFPCADMFGLFNSSGGIGEADVCSWISDIQVRFISKTLQVGDQLALLPQTVKPRCATTLTCDVDDFVVEDALPFATVRAPAAPLRPVVQLVYNRVVPACSELFDISATGSYNSGGRPFLSVNWTWKSLAVDDVQYLDIVLGNAQEENQLALKDLQTSLIPHNVTFTFTISVINFLGAQGSASATFRIADNLPASVTILSPCTLTVKPFSPLELFASVNPNDCVDGPEANGSTSALQWTETSGQLPQLVSMSNRPQSLLLQPYSLAPSTQVYSFAFAPESGGDAERVDVLVLSGDLILDIAGCNTTVPPSGFHTVTAEFSYDANVGPSRAGEDSGMVFNLSVNSSCENVGQGFPELRPNRLEVTFEPLAYAGCVLRFLVAASKDSRRAEDSCVVVVPSSISPVAEAYRETVGRISPNDKLVLRGLVRQSESGDVSANWTLVTGRLSESTTFEAAARTPLSTVLPQLPPISDAIMREFDLVLPPHSLSPKTEYVFRLEAAFLEEPEATGTTVVDIRVLVNSPPFGGQLAVEPHDGGVVLEDTFTFDTFSWVDDPEDLPLSYAFFADEFALNPGAYGANSLVEALLPQGLDANDNFVQCRVEVIDTLGAYATEAAQVEVAPLANPLDGVFEALNASMQLPSETPSAFQTLAIAARVAAQVVDEVNNHEDVQSLSLDLYGAVVPFLELSRLIVAAEAAVIQSILSASPPTNDTSVLDVSPVVQRKALDSYDQLVRRISESSITSVNNGVISEASEHSILAGLSILLRSTLQDNATAVVSIQTMVESLQRVRANSMVADEFPITVAVEGISSSTVVHRKYSDSSMDYGIHDVVTITPEALAEIDVGEGGLFLLTATEYSEGLAVYDTDQTTPYEQPIGSVVTNYTSTKNLRLSIFGDASVTSLGNFSFVNTRHTVLPELSMVNESQEIDFTLTCAEGDTEQQTFLCASGQVILLECTGAAEDLEGSCQNTGWTCVFYDSFTSTFLLRPECTAVVSNTTAGMISECRCPGTSQAEDDDEEDSSQRRLTQVAADDRVNAVDRGPNFARDDETQRITTDTASLFSTWGESFLESEPEVFSDDAERNAAIPISTLAVFLFGMSALSVAGLYLDGEEKEAMFSKVGSPFQAVVQSAHAGLWYGLMLLSPEEIEQYEEKPLWKWLAEEVVRHHDYIGTCFLHSAETSRFVRVVRLTAQILTVMMLDASFFRVLFAKDSDEFCEDFTDEESCEEDDHQLNEDTKRCSWQEAERMCTAVEARASIQAIVLIALFVVALSKPIEHFISYVADRFLTDALVSKKYVERMEKEREQRSTREEQLFRSEMELLEDNPRLRPQCWRSFSPHWLISAPCRRRLRCYVHEAVDLEFRLKADTERLDRDSRDRSKSARVALYAQAMQNRRKAIAMIGIRDNLPIVARALFRRHTRLRSDDIVSPQQKALAATLLLAYMAFCVIWVVLFAVLFEDELVVLWIISFFVAIALDVLLYMPMQVVIQAMLLPSILRVQVMLNRLERVRPTCTLSILARNNGGLIQLCPGIEDFVPLVAALRDEPQDLLPASPMKRKQKAIFFAVQGKALKEMAFAERVEPPSVASSDLKSGVDGDDSEVDNYHVEPHVNLSDLRGDLHNLPFSSVAESKPSSDFPDGERERKVPVDAFGGARDRVPLMRNRYGNGSSPRTMTSEDSEQTMDTEVAPYAVTSTLEEDAMFLRGSHGAEAAGFPRDVEAPVHPPIDYIDSANRFRSTSVEEIDMQLNMNFNVHTRARDRDRDQDRDDEEHKSEEQETKSEAAAAMVNDDENEEVEAYAPQVAAVKYKLDAYKTAYLIKENDRDQKSQGARERDAERKNDNLERSATSGSGSRGGESRASALAYGDALTHLSKVGPFLRGLICFFEALFALFLFLPDEAQVLVIEQIMPWTVGLLILFADFGFADDAGELAFEIFMIVIIICVVLAIIVAFERNAAKSVEELRQHIRSHKHADLD